MHDLMMDRLIGVVTGDGAEARVSLPGLMALMMRNEVAHLPAVRTHQRQGMHSFLVQLGAMAMEAGGTEETPFTEEEWRALLLSLTGEDHAPWTLVGSDWTEPAFMQPPVRREGARAGFRFPKGGPARTPGTMDILVTSKNHEQKQHEVANAEPEDWIMALITLQTMDNASGSGHKGVSRICDGSASRPALSLMPADMRFGAEVRRDILALLEKLPRMREEHPWYPRRGGIRLLWTEPWDGTAEESLSREALDILYIDVAMRARMVEDGGRLAGVYATSDKPRIQREPRGGITGDPWAPVDLKNSRVLKFDRHHEDLKRGVTSRNLRPKNLQTSEGFGYRNLVILMMSDDWKRPALLEPATWELESPEPMRLVGRAVARFQGKTFGYLEREVVMTPRFQEVLHDESARREAGETAMERIEQVAQLQGGLGWAIRIYLNGGKNPLPGSQLTAEQTAISTRVAKRLEAAVDRGFFDSLQVELEAPPEAREEARGLWLSGLFGEARELFRTLTRENPQGSWKQHRAEAAGLGAFERWLRSDKGFPGAFPPREEPEEEKPGEEHQENQEGRKE